MSIGHDGIESGPFCATCLFFAQQYATKRFCCMRSRAFTPKCSVDLCQHHEAAPSAPRVAGPDCETCRWFTRNNSLKSQFCTRDPNHFFLRRISDGCGHHQFYEKPMDRKPVSAEMNGSTITFFYGGGRRHGENVEATAKTVAHMMRLPTAPPILPVGVRVQARITPIPEQVTPTVTPIVTPPTVT